MNAPSAPARSRTPPDAPPLRSRPPASLGDWRWLRGRFQRTASSWSEAAPEPRNRPAPVFAFARSRSMSQGARSVLLWGLLFYVLIQSAVFVVMDRWHPMLFDHVWFWKWGQFREWAAREPDRPLMVMLGSSRTDDAFQARGLDGLPGPEGRPWRAYNFGVPAAGPMHEWLYLRDMLDAGIRPRLLLIEYLPPLLNAPRTGFISEEYWTAGPWLSATHLVRLWPHLLNPTRKGQEWLESRLAPAAVYRAHLQERLREWCNGEPPLPILLRGHDDWGCHLAESISQAERERRWTVSRELYGRSLRHFRPWPGSIHALHRLLKHCQREQIRVAVIVMPESPRFRALYTSACRTTSDSLLTELRHSGVPVIDANLWLSEDDFSDGHHVNERGGAKFTARLRNEVEPLLR
jgi:hypothetical protein